MECKTAFVTLISLSILLVIGMGVMLNNNMLNLKFSNTPDIQNAEGDNNIENNESLNNILQMCINATKVTTSKKTLKSIGLSEEQATKCTTLSNYQAFTGAGWVTGY